MWVATKLKTGYGRFYYDGGEVLAHRFRWFIETGKWPGLCVCHKCDNPSCVNFDHLFLGTHKDNMRDSASKLRMKPWGRKWIPGSLKHHWTNNKSTDRRRKHFVVKPSTVIKIRKMYNSGRFSYRDIMDKFGVTTTQVQCALHKWKTLHFYEQT